MLPLFSAAREAKTTLSCPHCKEDLFIKRTCHEVFMSCNGCQKDFLLKDFISQMDDVMESFLENLYTNRI